jgi:hypothetical protein
MEHRERWISVLLASAGAVALAASGAVAEDAKLVQVNDPYFQQSRYLDLVT